MASLIRNLEEKTGKSIDAWVAIARGPGKTKHKEIVDYLKAEHGLGHGYANPRMTMRLFAEEKRTGTIELLATSPIRDTEIIIGKWLAAILLYAVLLLFSAINFSFLFRYGNPDWKPLAIGYLGLLLQAGGLLAVGTFISTLTRNQIIAGAATFGACLLLWILEWPSGSDSATWAKVLAYCSVITHFDSFSKGVLDTKDAVYYLSLIFLGLFLTSRSMESLRWRS